MGTLAMHDVAGLRQRYACFYFVETGTWRGDGLLTAARLPFHRLWSIEASPTLAIEATARLTEALPRGGWEILVGDSAELLPTLLGAMLYGTPALWWLDAHLPERYGAEASRLPLQAEIEAIVRHARPHAADVFLIDDWRLYARGAYGSGDFPGGPPGDGEAVRRLLEPTHELAVDLRREGALVALPRKKV